MPLDQGKEVCETHAIVIRLSWTDLQNPLPSSLTWLSSGPGTLVSPDGDFPWAAWESHSTAAGYPRDREPQSTETEAMVFLQRTLRSNTPSL